MVHILPLCSLGHIATAEQLLSRRTSRRRLSTAIETGDIVRLRRGVYACAHLDERIAQAASIGGAVTCVTILRGLGVWAGHDHRPHVQLRPTASGVPPSPARLHWSTARFGMSTPWMVTPLQALWEAMHCLDEENAIAAMESAIHEGILSVDEVMRLAIHAPRRLTDGIRRLVPTSGSGNETIVRLRLQRVGYAVVPQGTVPGMGHQDLVIEDCVGIEVDSREWHGPEQFAPDRDRSLLAEGLGRRTLRLRPSHIYDSWDRTLAAIDRVVVDAIVVRDHRQERRFVDDA